MFKKLITRRPTVAKKLLFWFLLTTLLPLGISTYVNYKNSTTILKKDLTNGLIAIADNKALQIESFILEKKRDVTALANTPTIIDAVEKFCAAFEKGIDSPEYRALDKRFRPFLNYYQKSFGFYDLFLISSEGDILFTVQKEADFGTNVQTGPFKNTELANVFISTHSSMETRVSDFRYYPPSEGPATFIAAPILINGAVTGIVVFQVENKEAYALMQNYTGLGETGETLIGLKIGDEVVFANPLRHDPQAAFTRKIVIGSTEALPVQKAAQGIEGSGLSIDYRGEKILAVWRYLPSPRWGMVVKIDTKEAFASVVRLRNWSLFIGIITAFIVMLIALFISNSISSPIQALQRGAEIIGSGNLDYKVGVVSKDEIGQLSRAFDAMTENLKKVTASRNELNKIMLELERSNKELQQFAYAASHDLQEPLRMVASFTQLLERRYKDRLDSDAKEFIHFAVDGACRMQKLIDDLLVYSQVGAQKTPFEPTDCNFLLDQVTANLRVAIDENHAIVTRDDLPIVDSNASQMTQLFQNLISNAIKFRSSHPPRIHIAAERKGDEWLFSIKDNGIGIDPQYKDRIFKIFQRLHSRDEYPGTGIGLALCKKILEYHDGKFWVESDRGKGATFYFTLPVKGDEKP
jgi:signal transduction histidine kinase